MATELTVVDLPDAYEQDTALTPVDPGFVAGDPTGNTFRATGREILMVKNEGVGAATITVTSQPASRTGRTGDITNASIPAGELRIFQIFPRDGWESGGVISCTPSSSDLKLAVTRGQLQAAG